MNHCLPLSSLKFIPALCALSLATAAAGATTAYRCGADGRSYSQLPCTDGTAVALEADSRSAAQRSDAERIVQRDQALADRMRRERREQEAAYAAVPKGPAGIRGVPDQQASPSRLAEWQRAAGPKPKHNAGAQRKKSKKPALERHAG